jgi:hypothetical protein
MKNKFFIWILSLFAATIFSALAFADSIVKTYDYKDFTVVEAGYSIKLNITQSETYSIEIKADEDDFEYLRVKQEGERLKIYIDKSGFRALGDIMVMIKIPALTGLALSGASRSKISMDVSDKSFKAELSGSSYLEGTLKCADLNLSLSGASKVILEGSGNNLDVKSSGSSSIKMKNFSVLNVSCSLSGSSSASVNMNGVLDAYLSGASKVVYYGDAKLGKTKFSGSSSISRGD